MAQNDVEAMQADIEMLKDPENKMALSWDEREAKVSELEGDISAYNRGQSAMEKGAMWQFSRNTAALTTAIDNGEKISAEQLASTKQMADELWNNPDLPDSTRTTIANFYEAYEYRDEIAEFKKVAPAEQAEFLRKANAKEMTTANIDLVNRLERVHEATLTALQTDSMTYMEDIGMAEVGPLDMQNLAQSLARRQVIYDKTMGNFGMASGYLKEHEAAAFAEMINTAGTDKVIHIAERVHQGLSENAVFFWEQLKQKNVGAIAVAGQKFAQGDQLAARDIVFGSKLRKDQSIVLQNERSDYDSPIKTELGTSYAFNHIENKYREDSIKDVYAALAWRQGDTSGEIDSSLLDEAIEIVTGGIFDINGVSITSPKKGVTEDRMEQWVDNMDPEFIDMHGGSANMPSEQIADELKGGSLQIIPASANSYFIRRKDTGTYLAAKDGSELEIPYDDSFLVASPRRRRGPQR
jgi:tellurite resistance protein